MIIDSSLITLLSGFFIAGFLGSWHCGVMCVPMTCLLAAKKQLLQYQLGRLLSYVAAGIFAGTVSSFLLASRDWLKIVSVALISILLIISYLTKNNGVKTPIFISKLYWKGKNNPFLLGLMSVLLPCGWLYGFIMSALASRSALAGGLVMLMFWLSSLPALSFAQILLKKLIDQNDYKRQKIASVVLLGASLISLWSFLIH